MFEQANREIEFKAEGDGSTLTAYGSAFYELDSHDDIVTPGAYREAIPEFLKSGLLLFEHRDAIGKPLSAAEDAKGLLCKFRISNTVMGGDVKTLIADGVIKKMSIGYICKRVEFADASAVRGTWASAGYRPAERELSRLACLEAANRKVRILREVDLLEVSLVGFPACRGADVLGLKGGRVTVRELLDGLDRAREEIKAGRAVSRANRDRLQGVRTSLGAACEALDAFLGDHATDDESTEADGSETEENASKSGVARDARARLRAKLDLYATV